METTVKESISEAHVSFIAWTSSVYKKTKSHAIVIAQSSASLGWKNAE